MKYMRLCNILCSYIVCDRW